MKLMAISLVFFFFSLSSAEEIDFLSPKEVILFENFTVNITSSLKGIYDVKIIVQDTEKNTISEVYSNGWKSSFYYLKEAYPERKEYTLRVKSSIDGSLCVRMRKSGESKYLESCRPILISQQANISPISNSSKKNILPIKIKEEKNPDINYSLSANILSSPLENYSIKAKKISLNTLNKEQVFITNEEKSRIFLIYSVAVLCILASLMVHIRKI